MFDGKKTGVNTWLPLSKCNTRYVPNFLFVNAQLRRKKQYSVKNSI